MSQLQYNTLMGVGIEGLLADNGDKNVLSPISYLQDIYPGVGVVSVTGEQYSAKLPEQNITNISLSADLVTGNSVTVTISGTALTPVAYATSHDDTMDGIATVIKADAHILDAVVGGSNNRTITVTAHPGFTTGVESFVVTGGASQATATIENTNDEKFLGVALKTHAYENEYISSLSGTYATPYSAGEPINCLTKGRVFVKVDGDVVTGGDVYCRFALGTGAHEVIGGFRGDEDSAKAFKVPGAVWRKGATAGNLAVLEINNPV